MQENRKAITRGIIIDVGHGGIDNGRRFEQELEKDQMLEVSKYMYDRLKEMGIPVKIVRMKDETVCNKTRFKRIQSSFPTLDDTILISNHLNSNLDDEKMKIIYSVRNNDLLPVKIQEKLKKVGQNVLVEQKFLPTNPKKDFYAVLRNNHMNAIRIEFNCKKDRCAKKNYLEEAELILQAITDFANLPYVSKEEMKKNERHASFDTYVVEKGDTLWSIAKKFSVTKDALKMVNNISDNMVRVDSILTIPNCNVYTVQRGDSIFKIANQYHVSIDSLIKENHLEKNKLSVGKYIRIPKSIE